MMSCALGFANFNRLRIVNFTQKQQVSGAGPGWASCLAQRLLSPPASQRNKRTGGAIGAPRLARSKNPNDPVREAFYGRLPGELSSGQWIEKIEEVVI
jgi:hypothetical protein